MPRSSAKHPKASRLRSLGRYCLFAPVLFAAGISFYLEIKIRAAARELSRLEATSPSSPSRDAHSANNSRTSVPTLAKPEPAASQKSSLPRTWFPDQSQLEQQFKQARVDLGPDFVLIRGAVNQLKTRQRFHELYRMLGLSETEIAAFENEAADKNLTFNALVASDPKDIEAHARAQAAKMDQIVTSTLGTDYIEPFRLFLATSDLRNMTTDLAAISLVSGDALRPDQSASLLQACLDSHLAPSGASRIALNQINWEAVAEKSKSFLTPAQQTLLRAMIDRQNFHQTFTDITGLTLHRPIRGLNSR